MPHVSIVERLYLGAVAAMAVWVGICCYFIPEMSDSGIPWRLPALCATMLGAMYLSGAVFTATCMYARRWSDIHLIMPMIAIWTGGLTIVSLFYLPAFDFTRTQVLTWFGAYIIYPLIALGLMWVHRGQNWAHLALEPAPPAWARLYLLVQGGVMLALALCLLFMPRAVSTLWPWQTGLLMLQLYAAPLLSYGIGSLTLRRHSWSEIRLALVAMSVFTGAELAASLRYRSLFNGPTLSIALWFVWLAVTTGMLVLLSLIAFRRDTSGQRSLAWPRLHAKMD